MALTVDFSSLETAFKDMLEEDWFMSKIKHSYLVYKTIRNHRLLRSSLEFDLPFKDTERKYSDDCLVYSLVYKRYSFNNLSYLEHAPINLHICKDINEFNSLISAHALGVDLSSLWKQL